MKVLLSSYSSLHYSCRLLLIIIKIKANAAVHISPLNFTVISNLKCTVPIKQQISNNSHLAV